MADQPTAAAAAVWDEVKVLSRCRYDEASDKANVNVMIEWLRSTMRVIWLGKGKSREKER